MDTMQILSVVVFLAVMAAIVTEKIHRTVAAVAGGVLLVCLHVLTVDDAVGYIDFNTIGVLVGMMLFVAVVRNSGLFEYVAIKSAKLAKGNPWRIMLLFAVLTAVLSAFLDNVTTVLLVGPMTISIAGILGLNPVPFLLTQILASNIGGTATLIGDPPNIMIGSQAGLSFVDFIMNTGVAVFFIMAAVCVCFYFMYGRRMVVEADKDGGGHAPGLKNSRSRDRSADDKKYCEINSGGAWLCFPFHLGRGLLHYRSGKCYNNVTDWWSGD